MDWTDLMMSLCCLKWIVPAMAQFPPTLALSLEMSPQSNSKNFWTTSDSSRLRFSLLRVFSRSGSTFPTTSSLSSLPGPVRFLWSICCRVGLATSGGM